MVILDVTLLPLRASLAWVEGSEGVCWKLDWFLYAWWVPLSSTILRWAGMEREVRSAVVVSSGHVAL